MFRRVIQSTIDKGRLRFSEAQQVGQLESIGLDGKQVSNRLPLADSLKAQGSNVQERDVDPSSEDRVVDTVGHEKSLPLKQRLIDSI